MTSEDFKNHRIRRGLSQKQWSSVLGVSYSSVTKWETGGKIPAYVERLVDALDLGKVKIKGLSDDQQKALAKKLSDSGKTIDEYVSDLLKAVLTICLLGALVASLFHMAEGEHPVAAAMMGLIDAASMAGKTAWFIGSFGVEVISALIS